jgi:DNA-binding transcriptional MerR regulator
VKGLHKIGTVCRSTGFSAPVLRAWELRYQLLAPARGAGGQRLYTDEDLLVLRRVRQLLDEGRAIGEIAAQGRRALLHHRLDAVSDGEAGGPQKARLGLALGLSLNAGEQAVAIRSMQTAAQAAARLAARLDPARVIHVAVDTLADDFHAALARIWVFSPGENVLHLRASAGLSRRTSTSSRARIDLRSYRYKVGVVARTREPFVSNQIVGDREFEQRWVKRERLASVAILPLVVDDALQGILACFFRQALSEEVLGVLGTFATMAAFAIASQRALVAVDRVLRGDAPSMLG